MATRICGSGRSEGHSPRSLSSLLASAHPPPVSQSARERRLWNQSDGWLAGATCLRQDEAGRLDVRGPRCGNAAQARCSTRTHRGKCPRGRAATLCGPVRGGGGPMPFAQIPCEHEAGAPKLAARRRVRSPPRSTECRTRNTRTAWWLTAPKRLAGIALPGNTSVDEGPDHLEVRVVDAGVPVQELPALETAAEDPVGGGVEGDWKGEDSLQDPGLVRGWVAHSADIGLPSHHRYGMQDATGRAKGGGLERGTGAGRGRGTGNGRGFPLSFLGVSTVFPYVLGAGDGPGGGRGSRCDSPID